MGAQPSKLRWPVTSPLASAVPWPQLSKLDATALAAPDWNDLPPEDLSKEGALALEPFQPGDVVEYWSATHAQWMLGKVVDIRADGITYDLDVKRGAQRRKMRRCAEDFSGLKQMDVHVI